MTRIHQFGGSSDPTKTGWKSGQRRSRNVHFLGGGKVKFTSKPDMISICAEVKKNGSFCLKTNVDHKRVVGGVFHPYK